jgi:hypothetical protein
MKDNRFEDLRAAALGVGGALAAYYGYAAMLVLAGEMSLARPVTWLGLAVGVAAVGWAVTSAPRRRAPPPAAS